LYISVGSSVHLRFSHIQPAALEVHRCSSDLAWKPGAENLCETLFMVARLHSLMAGPQAGAAALHQTASRHAGSLTSAATLASAAALALLARHRRNRPYASAARPKR